MYTHMSIIQREYEKIDEKSSAQDLRELANGTLNNYVDMLMLQLNDIMRDAATKGGFSVSIFFDLYIRSSPEQKFSVRFNGAWNLDEPILKRLKAKLKECDIQYEICSATELRHAHSRYQRKDVGKILYLCWKQKSTCIIM